MGSGAAIGPAAVAEAKAYLRIGHDEEDALVARLVASAAGLCETFTGRTLIARTVREVVRPTGAWQRLGATPVRAIGAVAVEEAGGGARPLAVDAYAVDVDSNGDGWVRIGRGAGDRARVDYEAGMAGDWEALPEPLRQGVARLAAHFYMNRDADGDGVPAAVTALWRPWRRMRLA